MQAVRNVLATWPCLSARETGTTPLMGTRCIQMTFRVQEPQRAQDTAHITQGVEMVAHLSAVCVHLAQLTLVLRVLLVLLLLFTRGRRLHQRQILTLAQLLPAVHHGPCLPPCLSRVHGAPVQPLGFPHALSPGLPRLHGPFLLGSGLAQRA